MSSLTQKPGIKDRIRPSRTWIKVKKSKGTRATRAPAAFIHPCNVRDGRVKLSTINGADWSKRYPRIVESRARVAPNCL